MKYDFLIVGAGLFGSVLAERIANILDKKVLVIEKRKHIGGNCYSDIDKETNIEFHQYGTHIFHTSSEKAYNYIRQFTKLNRYNHQVLTTHKNKVYQMPINLETINSFYMLNLKPFEAKGFLKKELDKEKIINPKNLEEKAISLIGRPLYKAFIKEYTIKQWGKEPRELPPEIITRLPVRFNYREDYFINSQWQGVPVDGYTEIFRRMLDSPNIQVELDCDYFNNRDKYKTKEKTIYTGPIDKYFDYIHGKLEWRSVQFTKKIAEVEDFQGTSVMNFADSDVPYTRIHEPKHLHPERDYNLNKTLLFYETSRVDNDEPYYPITTARNNAILSKYQRLSSQEKGIIFGGRLGSYRYYDMDKTILAALECFEQKISPRA